MEAPPIISSTDPGVRPVACWRNALALLLLLALPPVMGLAGLSRSGSLPAEAMLPGNVPDLLLVSIQNLGIFLVLAALIAWLGRFNWQSVFARARCGWKAWALGLGYSVLFRVVLGIGMMAVVLGRSLQLWFQGRSLNSLEGFRPQIENLLDPAALRDPVYLLLSVTLVSFVVAGLREELWRAAVFASVGRWRGQWLESWPGRVAVSALAALSFGLGHLPQGGTGVWMTGALGLGLGLVLLAHRSLWVAVLAHGFFNATSFLLLRIVDEAGMLDQFLGRPAPA